MLLLSPSIVPVYLLTSMANILVLGAGELGEPILRHLISGCKPGTCVSLVVRPSTLADAESSQSPLAKHLVSSNFQADLLWCAETS